MKCKILHESKGRLRIHAVQGRMTLAQADILEAYLLQLPCVTDAKVYDRTCDAVIFYHGQRNAVLTALAAFRYENAPGTGAGAQWAGAEPGVSGQAVLHPVPPGHQPHHHPPAHPHGADPVPVGALPVGWAELPAEGSHPSARPGRHCHHRLPAPSGLQDRWVDHVPAEHR